MLLPGVLFALFLAGCWLYCLTDAARTPAGDYLGWPKRAWLVLIAVTFIVGALAWIVAGRRARARRCPASAADHLAIASLDDVHVHWDQHRPRSDAADAALARHPAGRSRLAGRQVPKGPDDDPEFLRQLARRIQGDPPG